MLGATLSYVSVSCTLIGEEADEDGIERTCDTLLMCIVTVLNQGLRNGGGVGDVLRKPSKDVSISGVLFTIMYSVSACL